MARAGSEGGKSVLVWETVQRREHFQQVVAGSKSGLLFWLADIHDDCCRLAEESEETA